MESHLLQMRGLKLMSAAALTALLGSHLLQMRGLKPENRKLLRQRSLVASFTDAWIETNFSFFCKYSGGSHLLQMRGLKPCPF